MGLFGFGKKEKDKMKDGLEKTRTGFWGNILNTLTGSKIDDDLYDELEEQLILADVGGEVAIKLVDKLRDRVKEKGLKTGEEAADQLRELIADEMRPEAEMELDGHPAVILVIGVNGVGKTTSIAKLADHYTRQGRRVMLAAGDTFRAAASEQLEIWADRAGVPLVKAGEGADPAAVIFDTVKSATARGYDLVIADTAGRLHNKANLMAELSKISRSVKKASPEASLETLLVLDAMLPGMDGYSVLEKVRAVSNVPVLMLTAKDQEEDKVAGLQNGADDYLTKPFGLAELTARVNSLVRRYTKFNPHHEENQRLRFHDMIIDPSAHSVEVQGKPVSLTAREFDILLFLAQHKGRIFTKQQIYQNIWKEPYYQDDGNIMSIISKLRKKIEPDPEHPFYVLTVYGVGYRFNEKA